MPATGTVGSVFLRENTVLPPGLIVETETFSPGWRAVNNYDGYTLGRKIEEAKWNFFYLAGEVTVIVLGRNVPETSRKAVRRAVAKPGGQKFNSAQISKIVSSWFLGIPIVSVTVNFRHIQKSLMLAPPKGFAPRLSAAEGVMESSKYRALVLHS